jgi:DNA repair protein RadA/Sms
MARAKTVYVCEVCAAESASWSGKCYSCGEWNTLSEVVIEPSAAGGAGAKSGTPAVLKPQGVETAYKRDVKRLSTGIADVDVVLGGGVVPGSVSLVAGQPGIGKSTLLIQLADRLAQQQAVLYVSGEESEHQVGLRAKRLGLGADKLSIVATSSAEAIAQTIASGQYAAVIVDSVQTITVEAIRSSAGSVSQITNATHVLSRAAKSSNTALILVGHVTKEGSIAGPKLLEHIVDVVLQLEGDRYGGFKVLRAIKNRYGSTDESAIFEMFEDGLRIVDNPSAALLEERVRTDGSVVLAAVEGSRPVLVEVQALVNKTSYGYPKRAASGIDLNRLNVLIAVLERRTRLQLGDYDIYVNIVGGIRLREPAADLAVSMAIASAAKQMALGEKTVVFGEVGLSGEVRHVTHLEKRSAEARKLGFTNIVGPRPPAHAKLGRGYQPVTDLRSALNTFLGK